ncbi:hypothetical protein ACMFMF_001582 [Clarireedia jacksonii]
MLPTHVVHACMIRGRPLFSADCRLMPQASAQDMLEDVITAYDFLRTELLTAPEFNKRTIYTYWSKRRGLLILHREATFATSSSGSFQLLRYTNLS